MFSTRRFPPVRSANLVHYMRRLGHMRLLTLTLATLALMAPIASASAAPPVRAGILQCQGGQNVGFVVGSVTSLECVFRSEGRRPEPTSPRCSASASISASPSRPNCPGPSTRRTAGSGAANSPAAMAVSAPTHRSASAAAATSWSAVPRMPTRCSRQRAGPDRAERRRRHRRDRTAAGRASAPAGATITGITAAAEDETLRKRPAQAGLFSSSWIISFVLCGRNESNPAASAALAMRL